MVRLAIIPLALLALLAGAVVWSNKDLGAPADFSFINRGENKTLDLGVMSWMQDIRIAYALYEGLYTPDPVTLRPIPGCADHTTANDAKTVYTFHIRSDAKWSNGDDLVAGDFVFAWRRLIEQPAEYSYLFDYVKGARAYSDAFSQWKQAIDQWAKSGAKGTRPPAPPFDVGVEAVNAKTLKVTLEHPLAILPELCAFPCFFPQYERCMHAFRQMDSTGSYVASYDQTFTRPPNLVTNGPYKLTEWSFKRRVRLAASDYYWDRKHVKSRIIDELYADDPLAQYRIYEAGNTDWLADVDGDMAADLLAQGRTDVKLIPAFGTYFYDFNCDPNFKDGSPNPFADRRVRRAFTMALDKTPIVQNVTRTGEPIATTYIPRGVFPDYKSPPGLPYDVAAARRLLAEAGYPGGAGFPHVTILFNNDFPQHGDIAQVVRRQWQVNLGVEVSLEGEELKVYADRLNRHEFAVGRGSWYGDYDDPSTFTDVYKATSQNNNPDWKNARYDALLKKAEYEKDPKTRFDILSQAENILLEDAPIMPMYQYVGRYLIHDNVHGIPLDPRQMVMLHAVEVMRSR